MLDRSAVWKALAASGSAKLEAKAVIDGAEYSDIRNPVLNRALCPDALSVGNCVSATLQFSVVPDADSAETVLKVRFTDGEKISEWITMGTFYANRRTANPGTGQVAFQGFDAMRKADAPFPSLSGFPKAMNSAVMEIARNIGVEVDGRTWANIPTGAAYCVPLPADGEKMIKVLGYIGGVCGGNWIITPRNRLRLVPLISASGAAESADAANIVGITGRISTGNAVTVTGVSASNGSRTFLAGNETGAVIRVPSNPYITQAHVNALLTKYNGLSYVPYAIEKGLYDPAAEVGDYLISRTDIQSVICQETAYYGPAFRGDISAPFAPESSGEGRSVTDSITQSGAVTEDLSIRIYRFTNQSAVTVGDGQSAEIINFDYAAGSGQNVIFHAEIKHTTATTETGDATDGWIENDAVITVTYYINGKAVDSYRPIKTETDGANLLHLTYHFQNGRFNAGNFRVALSLSGGSVAIAAGDANACIIGQGYSGTDDNWIAEDGLVFIGVESYPDKMEYETGDWLDLTGLVVKAYYGDGTEKDVTAQCVVDPAEDTAFDEEGETVVNISYTEGGKEYRDSFSVYCIGDQYRVLYIDVITPPRKTEYSVGEQLSLDGLVIGAYQENGHVIVNIKPDCRFSPAEGTALTQEGTVTVTATRQYSDVLGYGTFYAYFDVYVGDHGGVIVSSDYWTLYSDGTLYIFYEGDMPESGDLNYLSYDHQIIAVTFSDSVTSISDWAFNGCPFLMSVIIPDSVTSIGVGAFDACDSLTDVVISDSVTSIKARTFSDCPSLANIVIPDSVTSIGASAFAGCAALTSVTIPDSVTSIGEGAFSMSGLANATIPGSVTEVDLSMFYECPNLTSVVIEDGATTIHATDNAGYCENLTSITIPSSATTVSGLVWNFNDTPIDVYYGGTKKQWNEIYGGGSYGSYIIHYNSSGPS